MKKKKIFLFLVLITIFITGCGNSKEVQPLYDKNGEPIFVEKDNYDKIFSNANDYKGKFVKMSGKIFGDVEKGDNSIAFQMYTDIEKYSKDIAVYYSGDISLKSDDYVELTGYVYGYMEGSNAFGGYVSSPAIMATELKKSDYKSVVRPTIKEKTYNDKIINQFGCIIKITKVEYAEKETRLYVTAENQSDSEFRLYAYSSKIIQNSKQYDYESNYDAEYQKLQDDLQPGVKSDGILVFPPIEDGPFKFVIDGYNTSYYININDFTFDL